DRAPDDPRRHRSPALRRLRGLLLRPGRPRSRDRRPPHPRRLRRPALNPDRTTMTTLVLTNANLLDGMNPAVPGSTVVIDDERITSVIRGTEPPGTDPPGAVAADGATAIDLGGRTLMPGMATCHFHST